MSRSSLIPWLQADACLRVLSARRVRCLSIISWPVMYHHKYSGTEGSDWKMEGDRKWSERRVKLPGVLRRWWQFLKPLKLFNAFGIKSRFAKISCCCGHKFEIEAQNIFHLAVALQIICNIWCLPYGAGCVYFFLNRNIKKLIPLTGWYQTPQALINEMKSILCQCGNTFGNLFIDFLNARLMLKASSSLPDDLNLFNY